MNKQFQKHKKDQGSVVPGSVDTKSSIQDSGHNKIGRSYVILMPLYDFPSNPEPDCFFRGEMMAYYSLRIGNAKIFKFHVLLQS